jgi:predicted O-methyltransferase YrrM
VANLLLHSLKEFDEVIFAIVERLRPRVVLEIGSETGTFSERLLAYCETNGAKLVTIDPAPAKQLVDIAMTNDAIELVIGLSIPYLSEVGCAPDLALIDGDHNYYTVSNELELLHAAWQKREQGGAILLHDVGFPCGDRDCYYSPDQIPEEARHPHSFAFGVTLGEQGLVHGGFRGEGAFAWATERGGPKNGVRTAIDDFVKAHPEYSYRSIDAVFGLGALTLAGTEPDAIVGEAFGRYDNALVRRLEQNRLELYLKVIELQDRLNQRAAAE